MQRRQQQQRLVVKHLMHSGKEEGSCWCLLVLISGFWLLVVEWRAVVLLALIRTAVGVAGTV